MPRINIHSHFTSTLIHTHQNSNPVATTPTAETPKANAHALCFPTPLCFVVGAVVPLVGRAVGTVGEAVGDLVGGVGGVGDLLGAGVGASVGTSETLNMLTYN